MLLPSSLPISQNGDTLIDKGTKVAETTSYFNEDDRSETRRSQTIFTLDRLRDLGN